MDGTRRMVDRREAARGGRRGAGRAHTDQRQASPIPGNSSQNPRNNRCQSFLAFSSFAWSLWHLPKIFSRIVVTHNSAYYRKSLTWNQWIDLRLSQSFFSQLFLLFFSFNYWLMRLQCYKTIDNIILTLSSR